MAVVEIRGRMTSETLLSLKGKRSDQPFGIFVNGKRLILHMDDLVNLRLVVPDFDLQSPYELPAVVQG